MTTKLDFDAADISDPSVIDLDGATITHLSGGSLFRYTSGQYGMADGGGFCALEQIGTRPPNCKADATIAFDAPVDNLMFQPFFVSGGDAAFVKVMIDGLLMLEFEITSTSVIDLSDWSGITTVTLIDNSGRSDAGIAYGGFSYSVTAVPLPAALPPFLLALFLLGSGRFRRRLRSA